MVQHYYRNVHAIIFVYDVTKVGFNCLCNVHIFIHYTGILVFNHQYQMRDSKKVNSPEDIYQAFYFLTFSCQFYLLNIHNASIQITYILMKIEFCAL